MTLHLQRRLQGMLSYARKTELEVEARMETLRTPEWTQLLLDVRVAANAIEKAWRFVRDRRAVR